MTAAVLAPFVLALAAPVLHRLLRGAAGWVLALVPAGMTAYFALFTGRVAAGETIRSSYAWMPSLGIELSFYLDGLSLLFALLVCGIGALVVIYAGGYLRGHPQLGRFYVSLLLFMGSMLGVVLADNAVTLFVFWELTSLTSYLLIGFDHAREEARAAALQALLVTGLGGLALLAGLVLLAQATGTYEISAMLGQGELVRGHAHYLPILLLVLAGAFTKSAQFPFHFWLPNAMEAPTPVSAYLHSATMVKAGIYLLARLQPVLGGADAWLWLVTLAGAVTMFVGAWLAWQKRDLKRILAYSTISALGILTMLLGLGTAAAAVAAMLFLLAHALYKGALFLVAGAVDHETGARDADQLGGLARALPITATAAVLAALSMAGVAPLTGFLAKESFYEAILHGGFGAPALAAVSILSSVLLVAVAAMTGLQPFFGARKPTPRAPHEAPASLWVGPLLLAALGLAAGVAPALVEKLIAAAAAAVVGRAVPVELALWHGFTPVLGLSALTLAAGAAVYAGRRPLARAVAWLRALDPLGPERGYEISLDGMNAVARGQTRLLQNGYLRFYLLTIVVTTVGLAGHALLVHSAFRGRFALADVRAHEWILAGVMLAAALAAVRSRSRLAAVAALGVVGYGVALVYLWFGAPDLAMTQVMVETLTVILFVLMFYHLPRFTLLTGRAARLRDAVVALVAGGLMTALVLAATAADRAPLLSPYFAENSYRLAHGRNVVNVILVDFRGLDTLGEITVLAVAGVGVFALLKLRAGGKEPGR